MNCKNCNSELPEDSIFCPVCGQKCEENPEAGDTAGVSGPENSSKDNYVDFSQEGEVPQKVQKGKGKKIAAIAMAAVFVVAVGIGITAHAQISNFIRRSFSDPVSYYKHVETKNRDDGKDFLAGSYGKLRDSIAAPSKSHNISYKLELGQSLKTMLSMTGMDFSALENVEVTVKGKRDKNILGSQVTGLINGQSIISLNAYMDYDSKEAYMQIPELSEKYIDLSNEMKKMGSDPENDFGAGIFTMQDMQKYFPETEKIETLYETYTDLFIDHVDSVEKGTAEIEAAGVKAEYTDLKVTCKGKKVYGMLVDFLSALKDDKMMKEITENMGEDIYKQYEEGITSGLEELKGQESEVSDEDMEVVMHVYVDGSGEIAGRVIAVTLKEEASSPFTLTCLEPQNGSEVGTEISMSDSDQTYFTLSGKGTRKGSKFSGEFTFGTPLLDEDLEFEETVNTDELFTVKVSELDEDALSDGCLNGSFTIGTKALASVTSYELQFDSKEDKKGATQTLSVVCGGDKLITLTAVSTEGGDVPEIKKPAEGSELCDASDQEAMDAYMSEWKVEELLSAIKEKCGIDLSTYLALYNNYLLDEEDEYDPDDYDLEDYESDDYDYDDLYGLEDDEDTQIDEGILGL